MANYILGIDQGTTGTRAYFVDKEGRFYAGAYKEHRQIYPQPGWVEHDPEEIWASVCGVVHQLLEEGAVRPGDSEGIGLANQGETVMVWERATGKPIYNAIVWQCRRTADMVEELRARPGLKAKVHQKTGVFIDSYFSAPKIRWIL
ncbi:glycerol kinase, partial [Candidatus Hakubella thermalkaliphila]